jgi:hypothetical protein
MKAETRAKIQEALEIGYDFIYPYQSIYPTTALDRIRTIREAKAALAAEPDSIPDSAEKERTCETGEKI